ncbi:MAG: hypothetical protein H0X37_24405 [Herpetosiphonaceae bacterium]|nr:hypothetical protein [Herpetosiphonaceae bacterium]
MLRKGADVLKGVFVLYTNQQSFDLVNLPEARLPLSSGHEVVLGLQKN